MNRRQQAVKKKIVRISAWILCCVSISIHAQEIGLLCTDTNANPSLATLQGDARVLVEGRSVSKVFFFSCLADEIDRPIQVDKEAGLISERHLWSQRFPTNLAERAKLTTVAESYRKALDLRESERVRVQTNAAPLMFLVGGLQFPRAAVLPAYARAMADLEAGYKSKPSSVKALLYLELSILERELGRTSYEATLKEAIAQLNLTDIDFRLDVKFRAGLAPGANFERPECAILYLAGNCAEEHGEKTQAVERYTTLIERSPGSPLAWEACARLMRLASTGTEVKQLQELEQMLVDTYPLIWGCPREGLKLDKTAVPNAVHGLLTRVADGIKK